MRPFPELQGPWGMALLAGGRAQPSLCACPEHLLLTCVCHLDMSEDEAGLPLLDQPASTDIPLEQGDQFPSQQIQLLKCTVVDNFAFPVGEVNIFLNAVRYIYLSAGII